MKFKKNYSVNISFKINIFYFNFITQIKETCKWITHTGEHSISFIRVSRKQYDILMQFYTDIVNWERLWTIFRFFLKAVVQDVWPNADAKYFIGGWANDSTKTINLLAKCYTVQVSKPWENTVFNKKAEWFKVKLYRPKFHKILLK